MRKRKHPPKKGFNPALFFASEEHKNQMLIQSTHKANMILTLTVLHDKFGFGTVRLDRFQKAYAELLDSYNQDYVNVHDLNNTLFEETGLKVL